MENSMAIPQNTEFQFLGMYLIEIKPVPGRANLHHVHSRIIHISQEQPKCPSVNTFFKMITHSM